MKRQEIKILLIILCLSPFGLRDAELVQAAEKANVTMIESASKTVSKPLMNIDEPTADLKTSGNIKVRGWAISQSGIKEVKVYVNDTFVANAALGQSRPDVKNVYPGYPDADKSGYEYTINTSGLGEGRKAIKVEAVGKDGTRQTYTKNVDLTKVKPLMNIDEPTADLKTGGNIKVRGWAISQSGIKEVKVYVNDTFVANAALGQSRPDVKNVYSGYPDAEKSGYEYIINTSGLGEGIKNIKVQAVGKDGTIQESTKVVRLGKLDSHTWIDSPTANSTIKGSVKIRGWALNQSGVKEVKVYVNNSYIGSASLGKPRPDVKKVYPEYLGGENSGYEYTINTASVGAGIKTLKLQAIGNDGSIHERSISVSMINLNPKMNVDDPIANRDVINDYISVRGWAVNGSGVKEVKIYVDNKYIGKANIGKSRPDVKNVYSEYINADKSGYEYTINTKEIPAGMRELQVEAIGNDGSSQKYNLKLNIVKPKPKTHIDEPTVNKQVTSGVKVRGWAINDSGIKEIKIYVDNNYIGSANKGLSRTDVGKVYSEYSNANVSGYEYNLDTYKISQGTKTIKIEAIGYDGSKDEVTTKINIIHKITTYNNYPNSFNSYLDIQLDKKPMIQDNRTLLWRTATTDEIEYYMNPMNFVNDSTGKYMFLKLNYSEGIQAYQLNNVLKGKGVLEGKGQAFIEAGRRANVNPIYLVAHALLETGNGTSTLARGAIKVDNIHEEFGNEKSSLKSVQPRTIYNMYGIGALDDDADLWGSEKAYSESWFTVEDAIIGGARWIGSGYINSSTYNQNTLYKMRWDFSTSSMWHQYATDVAWAYKQTSRIKSIVESMDDPVIHFEIPRFN